MFMEESLVKIADHLVRAGLHEYTTGVGTFKMPSTCEISLGEHGWSVRVSGGASGLDVRLCHPKLGEALRRAADNLPPLPEK